MWIWDGTDREEGDGEAAFADAARRALISSDPELTAAMRTYVAAFSLALTSKKSCTLTPPEPLIQGGFTPSDEEREMMCETARRDERDIIHICFRTVAPFTPTGLIVVVYRDGDNVRLHSRLSPIWVAKDRRVRLCGVEDERDLYCHFVVRPGGKMVRRDGLPTPAGPREMQLAGAQVQELIKRGAIGDVGEERLTFFPQRSHHADGSPVIYGLRGV